LNCLDKSELDLPEEEVEKFYAYGFAQYGSGNWADAVDVFRVLCTRRPFEARFWFALGATLQESGSYKEALHSWAMAALLKKEDPYPHFHAAECCLSLQMTDDAAMALQESSLRLKGEFGHPLTNKIGILKEQWRL
jgi:type III secretion system low calcium response chaperone LcrH/SycD